MLQFIRVKGSSGETEFIALDKIVRVSCSVTTKKTGGELEPMSLLDPSKPKTTPVQVFTTVSIRLFTANGDGEIRFDSESKADSWAQLNLGIRDFTTQFQYSPA